MASRTRGCCPGQSCEGGGGRGHTGGFDRAEGERGARAPRGIDTHPAKARLQGQVDPPSPAGGQAGPLPLTRPGRRPSPWGNSWAMCARDQGPRRRGEGRHGGCGGGSREGSRVLSAGQPRRLPLTGARALLRSHAGNRRPAAEPRPRVGRDHGQEEALRLVRPHDPEIRPHDQWIHRVSARPLPAPPG